MHGESVLGGLVAFSLLKKATAYSIARYYGFPRLYRKMARVTMRAVPEQAPQVNAAMKNVFRFPNRVATRLRRWRGPAAGSAPLTPPPSSPSPTSKTPVSAGRRGRSPLRPPTEHEL